MMKKTLYRKVTIFIGREVEYKDDEDLRKKSVYLDGQIDYDMNHVQNSGDSDYNYVYEVVNTTREKLIEEDSILVESLDEAVMG